MVTWATTLACRFCGHRAFLSGTTISRRSRTSAIAVNGTDGVHAIDLPARRLKGLFTDDGVALGVGVQSSEERHAGRFLLALGETGTGGGDAGRGIHLVRTQCGSESGGGCDPLAAGALFAQGLDLVCRVRARWSAQALELACR